MSTLTTTAPASAAPSGTFTEQATLTPGDAIGHGGVGSSVALSRNGNTALVASPADNNFVGAAWIFTRKQSRWIEQAKITGAEEIGNARFSAKFGSSVALSADGNTALIGGPRDNEDVGAAWVFTRSKGKWTQEGPKLTGSGESGTALFGSSVALSAAGNTALIGGFEDTSGGGVWVFTRSGSTWTQQGPKLTGAGESGFAGFGQSVALSAAGNTALIGGPFDGPYATGSHSPHGAAWVFTRSGSSWTQQGDKLTNNEELEGFGNAVALSAGGNTALISVNPNTNLHPNLLGFLSGAMVFTRTGDRSRERLPAHRRRSQAVRARSLWTQRARLNNEGEDEFGHGAGLALSSDGTALIGGSGASWVFTGSGSAWTQQFPSLACGEEGACGVALSGRGSTALVGTTVFVR